MPLRADIAAKIGRADLAQSYTAPTGSSVEASGNGGLSVGAYVGGGRDGLILLAALLVGVVAFSWWTR